MSSAARKPDPAADGFSEEFLRALDEAPVGEPDSPEVQAEIEGAMEDVRAGRVVPHEEVMAWLKATKPEGEDWPDGE